MNPNKTRFDAAFPEGPGPRERARLLRLIREISLRRGRFVLSSGAISDYYLDLRLTTTHPEGARLSAAFLLQKARQLGVNRVGGPTLGADPLVGAAVALSGADSDLRGFLVRSQAKDHGTGRQIEGHLAAGDHALVLDDVVTAGGSIVRAIEAVRATGATVAASFCLVDRGQGGREKLAEAGAPLSAVFAVEEVLAPVGAEEPLAAPVEGRSRPITPALTVDAILEIAPGRILLVQRRHPPLGWALPGGFVDWGESAEEALHREVREETGLIVEHAVQMHAYSEPGRDPRLHTASLVFVARAKGTPRAGDDAGDVRAFPLDALPQDLCFDHRDVLEDFRNARFGVGPGAL